MLKNQFVEPKNMQITCISAENPGLIIELAFNGIPEFIEEISKQEKMWECTDVVINFLDTGKRHQFYTIKETIAYYQTISNQKIEREAEKKMGKISEVIKSYQVIVGLLFVLKIRKKHINMHRKLRKNTMILDMIRSFKRMI